MTRATCPECRVWLCYCSTVVDTSDVVDLLADEWPTDRGWLDWEQRAEIAEELLGVLSRNGYVLRKEGAS